MREVITIQVLRPNFESLDAASKKRIIDDLSKSIAEQIVKQEFMRSLNENVAYWQDKLLSWEIEDELRRINGYNTQ